MSIWFNDEFPLAHAIERHADTLSGNLGIEFIEAGEDFLRGRMPVDERTVNPSGVLHGGASIAFAESLGSYAGNLVVDSARQQCVGLEINGNHVRPVQSGAYVYGTARPEHLGSKTQIWQIRIENEQNKLVCLSRITLAVLEKASKY
ncbi:hotdog fold thioesterase [Pseudomonas aeruginosa]|jgi:1,4-dihydroxy-2-naphthoyl-CoA hydrolase|uniref:hotdog fold thioesterase n=1 Tax=Pseudomonas TaxID=286 RepID=UPI000C2A7EE6|nr:MULTISPECIES: hotdog fold thioesterase [Pseudomonas]MBF8160888.1 hotdog fold thioesterase [Pseudomonas mendocina]MBA4243660.1 esterase [Pseudomonas sp.]MEB3081531.1 hotdog fold thioesterase [Pseudomonas aeruginosa]MEB3142987.1 hotdog fold thioesterase [Pseudomonas aeruginosa]PJX08534.1 esterase [Pseudomonas putida]